MRPLIAAIVPAYNEQKNIHAVLNTLVQSKHLDEIICINDGSTDNTLEIIKKVQDVKLINFEQNHGKAHAIAKGVATTNADLVVFIDADLSGLTDKSIKSLIDPLVTGGFDATVGYPIYYKLDHIFKPVSGERAYFKKDLLPHLDEFKDKGYGLELYLNYLFRGKKVKALALDEIRQPLKHEKQSIRVATKQFIIQCYQMTREILKQKNPITFFSNAYLYPFYLERKKSN